MMNFTFIIIFKNSPTILFILEITMLPIELEEKKNLLQNSFVHWKRKLCNNCFQSHQMKILRRTSC